MGLGIADCSEDELKSCSYSEFMDSFTDLHLNEPDCSKNRPEKVQSKSEKKLARYTRIVERRKEKRRKEHKTRKINLKTKNKAALVCDEVQIAIDLSYCYLMSPKELAKLARQMGRVWGLQKLYEGRRFVYLSPDSELEPLLNFETSDVFIIGGLVDETGKGSLSREKAASCNYLCRRLPISEFMVKESGTFNVMLTINQVVEILCRYARSKDWKESLGSVVPKRTGYVVTVDDK
uniref:SAM-dependent MTase TRM10-type domain-containing protein n=1 Tax=Acrobeloides nanus TaxID=290746 RepID=A0A914CC31_9BILA